MITGPATVVKRWQRINCWGREIQTTGSLIAERAMLKALAQPRPPSLRIFRRARTKAEVFCGKVPISGMFDGREGGCFALFIDFFAFCLQTQAEPLHGSPPWPTLHWTTTAAPNKKVPKGKPWLSWQLIKLNDDLRQHPYSQPRVAGCCMSHHELLRRVCNRDLLQPFFLAQLL